MKTVATVLNAAFSDPGEGVAATADRLVLASHRASEDALRTLVYLTAMAAGSRQVVSMTAPSGVLDELEDYGLIRRAERDTVVLL